jgi:tRNA(fMet)-specific endonuclease VapC
MIILDTDCLSLLERGGTPVERLLSRLEESADTEITTTIINFEKQMRGWLSFIAKASTLERQVVAYERLQRFLDNYRSALVLPFEEVAAIQYARLRGQKLKLASMDLKIAAITIANDALLISRNLSDFSLVPDLRVADWTR